MLGDRVEFGKGVSGKSMIKGKLSATDVRSLCFLAIMGRKTALLSRS